jgi:hypothetical protein
MRANEKELPAGEEKEVMQAAMAALDELDISTIISEMAIKEDPTTA